MPETPSDAFVRTTLVHEDKKADLLLPSNLPVAELLPSIARRFLTVTPRRAIQGFVLTMSNGATIARGWERLERSPADYARPRTPARARMSVVAWTCALIEASIGRTTWRDATAPALRLIRLHLRSLEAWGYVLADVETDLCEAVEEAADAGDLHTVPTASAGKGTAA